MALQARDWMDVYNSTVSDLETVRVEVQKYQGGAGSSNIRQKRNLAKKVSRSRENITKLNRQLLQMENNPAGFGIGDGELNRRRDLASTLQSLLRAVDDAVNDRVSAGVKSSLFTGTGSDTYKETNETKNMSDQRLLQQQYDNMQEQDSQLDNIFEGVRNLKYMSKDINKELGLHERLIDDIETAVERTDGRIESNIRGVSNVHKKEGGGCCAIIIMLVLFAFIIFILATDYVCKLFG